jgi:predicted ATPase/class 3 adenylate cyclase
MEHTASFGYWLKRRRKARDLTQAALAQLVGCAVVTIRKIEADEFRPSVQIAEKLAECLAIPREERAVFLKAARAALSPDHLALPTAPVEHTSVNHPADVAVLAHLVTDQRSLPSGTVTFLFTDIEGSTALWQMHPQAMRAALARHDAILRAAVEARAGVIFKTVGDSISAAFASAPDALAAALDAQCALLAEDWGTIGAVRVRMALHTGTAEVHDGDYLDLPLSRVARLLHAGHGGQVLLSRATQELVRDELPPDLQVRDLGEHRLKDFTHPEHIFQLVAPDLPLEFPPLRTLASHPTDLPVQPTPLIGREQEVEQLGALLHRPDVRLVTLTGAGGSGKTRLAIQTAAELLDAFTDGVFFVALAPIRDPFLVGPTIAKTLGIGEVGGLPLLARLEAYLRARQLLLVIDNFEQVLAATPLIAELLVAAPHLKVLVTSRSTLHLLGEHEFLVRPLAIPDPQHLTSVEALSRYAAVEMFIQRAQMVKTDFTVTNANASTLATICQCLDGLPLAIELAAAWSKFFTPEALLGRLSSRLGLLRRGSRDVPARQQTLRGAFDWSYDLLGTGERTLFQWLAVFVGGCTLEAVEAVCHAEGYLSMDVVDGLAALVDQSLLQQVEGPDDEPRFVMLETIREYALERLAEQGEAETLQERHAAYYLVLAEHAAPQLTHTEQKLWLNRLERDHDNLRAALGWFLERGEAESGWRLVGALGHFWYALGYWTEGRQWCEKALSISDHRFRISDIQSDAKDQFDIQDSISPMIWRAKALYSAGILAKDLCDYQQATALLEESLTLCGELEDTRGIAGSLNALGEVAQRQGDGGQAAVRYDEGLELFRVLDDRWGVAQSLRGLGRISLEQGDYEQATTYYQESLELFRKLGYQEGIAYILNSLGEVMRGRGDYEQAGMLYEESLALARELGIKRVVASTLHNLGSIALYHRDTGSSAARFRESLALFLELSDKEGLTVCLAGLAAIAVTTGQPARAGRLFGAAEAVHLTMGGILWPTDHAEQAGYMAAARAQLDEATFTTAWAEGQAMALEQAITYALDRDR